MIEPNILNLLICTDHS